jgi:hypothetical protein
MTAWRIATYGLFIVFFGKMPDPPKGHSQQILSSRLSAMSSRRDLIWALGRDPDGSRNVAVYSR